MTKVSIVMPVFNKADYLDVTINALLNQKYKDWELIIVDDGSTDMSSHIIECYALKDNRIHSLKQDNKGVSAARNAGKNIASGEWIWFVDADDLPNMDFLESVFSKKYDEKIGIIVGNYERLESNGFIQGVQIDEQGVIPAEAFADIFMKYQYKTGFWGYLWNKLIKRELLIQKDIKFQEGLALAEDLKFMVALYQKNIYLYCVPESAMRYTVDATNASNTKKIDYRAQLDIQLIIKNWIVDNCKKIEYAPHFKWIISRYAAFVVYYGFEDNEDCIYLAKSLVNNQQVALQLCVNNVDAIMRPIVWCLVGRRYFLLRIYLFAREKIRDVYRIFSH